jgi:two-component sensor histidine kinase
MRIRCALPLACGLGLLALAACGPASADSAGTLPYVLHQRYAFSGSPDIRTLDADHDGRHEILTFDRIAQGPYALILHDLPPAGPPQARWQFNQPARFSFEGGMDLDDDRRNELCIYHVEGDTLLVKVYDQTALARPLPAPRWTAPVTRLTDANGDGKTGTSLHIAGVTDINGDPYGDLIVVLNTDYDLTPRGIVALDGQTGRRLWSYAMGAWPSHVFLEDVTGDGKDEMVMGASAPGNGASANGTDDLHSYLILLDRQGRLLWLRTLGELSTNVLLAVADVNGDLRPDPVTVMARSSTVYGEICIWDGATGQVQRRLNSPWSITALATADLDLDGKEELLLTLDPERLIALDGTLKTIQEHRASGRLTGAIQVYDLDRNGYPEVLYPVQDTTFVLDHRFRPLAALPNSRIVGAVQTESPDRPLSVLMERSPGQYGLYDLRPAPVLSRMHALFLPYAASAGWLALGAGLASAAWFGWARYRQKTRPTPVLQVSVPVMAWVATTQALAHELKSPLNVMSLTIRHLTQESNAAPDPACQTLLEEIDRLQQRANALMRFVSCAHLNRKPLDLNALVADRARRYRQSAGMPAEVIVTPEADLPAVHADPGALEMILDNLMGNALAALDGQGQILLTTRCTEQVQPDGRLVRAVVLEVMDTGAGIPPENLAKVFEPTFTTRPGGTGFGLPIVKHLAEAHGGRVDLKSREGIGTTVTVTLPVSTGA